MKISLNRNQIKYLAIIAMLIDHLAWKMFDTMSVTGQIMHFIGRLTGPTMAIMVAEGYQYTRNVKKYALRLGLFALISWVPFSLFETGTPFAPQFGVIYTLFLGLMAICVWDRTKLPKWLKIVIIVLLCILSLFGDWPIFDVLWPFFLFIYRDDKKKKWTSFIVITIIECVFIIGLSILGGQPFAQLFQLGAFMVPVIFLYFYNGESGSRHPFHKWFFYIFYPLHLLILAYIFVLR